MPVISCVPAPTTPSCVPNVIWRNNKRSPVEEDALGLNGCCCGEHASNVNCELPDDSPKQETGAIDDKFNHFGNNAHIFKYEQERVPVAFDTNEFCFTYSTNTDAFLNIFLGVLLAPTADAYIWHWVQNFTPNIRIKFAYPCEIIWLELTPGQIVEPIETALQTSAAFKDANPTAFKDTNPAQI